MPKLGQPEMCTFQMLLSRWDKLYFYLHLRVTRLENSDKLHRNKQKKRSLLVVIVIVKEG